MGHGLMKERLAILACLALFLVPLSSLRARVIKNRALKDIDGRTVNLWKKGTSVAVLLFFKVGQRYTEHAFKELKRCRKDIGKRPVSFVGVVSDNDNKAAIKKLLAGLKMKIPVIVDAKRSLAAELTIRAYPTFAMINPKKKSLILQPVMRIGLCESLLAKLRQSLGEISDGQRKRQEDGAGITRKSQSAAKRYEKLASMMRAQKQYKPALAAIDKSLEKNPRAARAHAIRGEILVDLRKCGDAARAFKRALELNASDSVALAGKKRACK